MAQNPLPSSKQIPSGKSISSYSGISATPTKPVLTQDTTYHITELAHSLLNHITSTNNQQPVDQQSSTPVDPNELHKKIIGHLTALTHNLITHYSTKSSTKSKQKYLKYKIKYYNLKKSDTYN